MMSQPLIEMGIAQNQTDLEMNISKDGTGKYTI